MKPKAAKPFPFPVLLRGQMRGWTRDHLLRECGNPEATIHGDIWLYRFDQRRTDTRGDPTVVEVQLWLLDGIVSHAFLRLKFASAVSDYTEVLW